MTTRQISTNIMGTHRRAGATAHGRWLGAIAVLSLAIEAQAQSPLPPKQTTLPPGLYVQVLDGLIHLTNPSGTSNFSAGQFGYTNSPMSPPVIVPKNPAMQFIPPPAFNPTPPLSSTPPSSGKSNSVECVVR